VAIKGLTIFMRSIIQTGTDGSCSVQLSQCCVLASSSLAYVALYLTSLQFARIMSVGSLRRPPTAIISDDPCGVNKKSRISFNLSDLCVARSSPRTPPLLSVVPLATRSSVDSQTQGVVGWNV